MSDEQIGPGQRCFYCGGEYGMHQDGCPTLAKPVSDDLVSRLRELGKTTPIGNWAADALEAKDREIAEVRARLQSLGVDLDRCPVMLPNTYGTEQCGRRKGHEGKCCYQRGD